MREVAGGKGQRVHRALAEHHAQHRAGMAVTGAAFVVVATMTVFGRRGTRALEDTRPVTPEQLYPPLNTLVAGLPPAFLQAVAHAVAYDVVDRYPDVVAFGVALGEALGMPAAKAVAAMQP